MKQCKAIWGSRMSQLEVFRVRNKNRTSRRNDLKRPKTEQNNLTKPSRQIIRSGRRKKQDAWSPALQ